MPASFLTESKPCYVFFAQMHLALAQRNLELARARRYSRDILEFHERRVCRNLDQLWVAQERANRERS